MDRDELEGLDRESLVRRAEAAGIRRARILTRPELIDELLRLDPHVDEMQLKRSRGFFGRARDLLSRVVERGLHLPDAATRIRWTGTLSPAVPPSEAAALPTLTLAEIYAAQGHKQRAIETLRRVLEREPEHASARALLARLEDVAYVAPEPPLPPEPEVEPEPAPPPEDEDEEASAVEQEEDVLEASADAYENGAEAALPIEVREIGEVIEEPAGEPAVVEEPAAVAPSDDCIALPLAEGAIYAWWRVSKRTIDALASSSSARFTLRAVIVEPSWDGPVTTVRDREVGVDAGEAVLVDLPVAAVVRVAVGILEAATFLPIAHSPALETEVATESAQDEGTTRLVRWTVEGAVPVALDDPDAPVSRALAGARRAARSARGVRI